MSALIRNVKKSEITILLARSVQASKHIIKDVLQTINVIIFIIPFILAFVVEINDEEPKSTF